MYWFSNPDSSRVRNGRYKSGYTHRKQYLIIFNGTGLTNKSTVNGIHARTLYHTAPSVVFVLYIYSVIIVRTSIFIFFSLTKTPLIKYNDLFYSVVLTSSFIDTDHVWIIWLLDERPWHWHPWMDDRSEKSLYCYYL